jgi:hypothetical protein
MALSPKTLYFIFIYAITRDTIGQYGPPCFRDAYQQVGSIHTRVMSVPLPAGGKIHGQISGPAACRFHGFGGARKGDNIEFKKAD